MKWVGVRVCKGEVGGVRVCKGRWVGREGMGGGEDVKRGGHERSRRRL